MGAGQQAAIVEVGEPVIVEAGTAVVGSMQAATAGAEEEASYEAVIVEVAN